MSLREAMDRLFVQGFTPIGRTVNGESHPSAPANLWEDESTYYLHILAPALDVASVDITVLGGMLTVTGQTTHALPEGTRSVWQEWTPTSFRRQVKLPTGFDAERCQATYKDGVLTISVPKPEQARPKAIKIQVQE
jgi:HSP20 family protein